MSTKSRRMSSSSPEMGRRQTKSDKKKEVEDYVYEVVEDDNGDESFEQENQNNQASNILDALAIDKHNEQHQSNFSIN